MLVLSRKEGEKILIFTSQGIIAITAMELRHLQVRLGIDAPPEIKITRAELVQEKADGLS
jgi:carbon storage regulator